MWTAAKTLSALHKARAGVLRAWQKEARAICLHWDRKHFTQSGPATGIATLLLDGLIAYFEARAGLDPHRFQKEAVPSGEDWLATPGAPGQECCCRLAALSSEWSDTRTLLSLLIACTRRALAEQGADEETLDLCVRFLEQIGSRAADMRLQSLEQALKEQREEAILMQQMTGRLLANASHELRTPLSAVLGVSELLLEESYGPLTPGQKTVIGHIANSAQNLLEIVNSLLDQEALKK